MHDLMTLKDLPTYLPTCQPPYENNFKEQSHRLVTFETFDQSDEETWPDQKELPSNIPDQWPPTYLPTYLH